MNFQSKAQTMNIISIMDLDFAVEPRELLLDEAAVLVVELARRLQDCRGDVVGPNILKI